jgi:alkanesulfonate monooxygenase SsuD/methylene tetrahydromethanopterin reductase-like flavin-dependent oxidoreductase (luciferase family)
MEIGVGLTVCRMQGDRRPPEQLCHEAIEHAVEAEAMGVDFCWAPEHHFHDSQINLSPLVDFTH